jgi:hypothetical protein
VPFVLLTPATAGALGAAGYVPSVPTVPLDACTFPSARAAAVRSSILAHSAAIQQATGGEQLGCRFEPIGDEVNLTACYASDESPLLSF